VKKVMALGLILSLTLLFACGEEKKVKEKETALEKHLDSQLKQIDKAEEAVEKQNENVRKLEEASKSLEEDQ